jgi:FixJ family two-component response regulator
MTATCVALVDDEAPVRRALGRLLRLTGHEVLSFASGQDFLDSLDTRRPDCVLLDIQMPGMTGLQVRDRLMATHPTLPVVFITGGDDPGLAQRALAGGTAGLLRKPFSREVLLDAVALAMQAAARRP